jgi:hypothetical protein
VLTGSVLAAGNIPYPNALEDANVTLSSMSDGQSESLMLGNGDLYGVVWENNGGLFMRITKNDIWDARVDTSKDGPLPKVDVATRKVTGAKGAPPSYSKLYPQPRCAAALRFAPFTASNAVLWSCARGAPKHAFTPAENGAGAVMEVSGSALHSTGYRTTFQNRPLASSLQMTLSGSRNAEYYIDIFGSKGKVIHASGWKPSPISEKTILVDLLPEPIEQIILYTRTTDGKTAVNEIRSLCLLNDGKKTALTFRTAQALNAHLDIRKAYALIEPPDAAATTVRILHDRNVVLINSPHAISIEEIKAATLPAARLGMTNGVSWLLMNMPGDIDYKGMDYALALARKDNLKAVSLVTSFDTKTDNVLEKAIALAKDTVEQNERELIAKHETAWQQFWSRSGVALADKDIQRWWYRLLYFAKTVCKPGAAPVALMPPLATDATPWHADYHHNYNAWQAFWPLPAANQSELADPWISYIDAMLPRFKWLARQRYGVDGVSFPISSFLHEPNPAGCKSKNNRQLGMNPWGMTIGMTGMSIQSMWQKHICDPDTEYMREKIYPTLREGAVFYLSFMDKCKKDDQGKVLLGPSYSPEHGPMGINNCPFDIAYVHYTFDALIRAATELQVDKALVEQCRRYKALVGPYPTAMDKSGKPVVVDWQGCNYRQVGQHNIEVPASPVFPGDQVTWFSPESEKELFRRTIMDTRKTGNNSHVMFNIAKARLSMLHAVGDAKAFFLPRTLPNGFIRMPWAHGTFMQEMIGVVGLVNEFMMQSVGDIIRVFPCWPEDKDASFADLRAQGGFLVNAEQKKGKVILLKVTSTAGGTLRLLSPWTRVSINGAPLQPDARGIVTIDTRPSDELVFEPDI